MSNISEPRQVTDIYKFEGMYAMNVDFQRQEYRVCWDGDWRKPPRLGAFPRVDGAIITLVPHSHGVEQLWIRSQVLHYGADSHIRLLDHSDKSQSEEQFPVCKVAVDNRQRQLIEFEFAILRYLRSKAVPVARVHPDPLADENGVFGFQMEKLFGIGLDCIRKYQTDIIKCLNQIHTNGIVHNDFHPGNILKNHKGEVVVIDFGRSGYVGSKIPPGKRLPWWQGDVYSFEVDKVGLERFFGMSKRLRWQFLSV
ncbi:hypothetical protein QBC46DRAFT_318334 [Diplogelasinospora grovesii]|uniref:Protein kinase domain-containing protein n=1 Tax=Diplogelasinospora grovesii TaxID=303347 RepID=A0AAN6S351_9PEZI|nr:hypothetical protein QBC46DRAFT_318334 [Diplogelasinospora grovesii]